MSLFLAICTIALVWFIIKCGMSILRGLLTMIGAIIFIAIVLGGFVAGTVWLTIISGNYVG